MIIVIKCVKYYENAREMKKLNPGMKHLGSGTSNRKLNNIIIFNDQLIFIRQDFYA